MITDGSVLTMPVPSREEAAIQGEQEYAALLTMLRSLSGLDWLKPTECPGWTVCDMVAHLAGAAEEAVRPGVLVWHLARARTRDRALAPAESLSAQQIADRAGRSPAEILVELESLANRAPRRRAKVPRLVRGRRLPAAIGAPQQSDTMAYLLDVVYNRDVWMHRVDIDRATGCGLLASGAEPAVVEQVVRDLSRTWRDSPFSLILTGRVEGTWRIGQGSQGDDTITADAVALCRLLSGRSGELDPVHGRDAGLVQRLRAVRILF